MITSSSAKQLRCTVSLHDAGVLRIDGAMLVQDSRAPNFWVLNNNQGSSGVESADDADSASYDTVGFDVNAVAVTHPWTYIPPGTGIWEHLKELGDACGNTYLGMDACGTLKLRAKLKSSTGYPDSTAIETINSAYGVDSVLETAKANKIVGHGVKVEVYTGLQVMWSLDAVPTYVKAGGKPNIAIAPSSVWPKSTDAELWAKYGEVV
jgi:hypothetical protein